MNKEKINKASEIWETLSNYQHMYNGNHRRREERKE